MQAKQHTTTSGQELFGVGVRLLALYSLLQAFQSLLDFAFVKYELSGRPEGYLLYAFGFGAFAIIVLSNAAAISRFTDTDRNTNLAGSDGEEPNRM